MTDVEFVRLDLTRPPGRDEAGMAAGRSVATYQREDRALFRVELILPDGDLLGLRAGLLTLDSFSQPEPEVAPPTTLDLHTYPTTLEAGRDELLSAARRLGMDATTTQSWYRSASEPRPGPEPRPVDTGWLRTTIGYMNVQVRGTWRPPVADDDPTTAMTSVHYLLTW